MVILENIDIDIDIDKAILQNIDIDKISNRFKFGISNRANRWWREITLQVWASQVWHPAIGGEGRLLWHPGSCKVSSPLSLLFTLSSTFSAFQTPFSTWLESPAGTSWFPFGHFLAPPSLERLWSRCTFRWGIILIKSLAKFKLLLTFRKCSSS